MRENLKKLKSFKNVIWPEDTLIHKEEHASSCFSNTFTHNQAE